MARVSLLIQKQIIELRPALDHASASSKDRPCIQRFIILLDNRALASA
jgi:hypothetical protein